MLAFEISSDYIRFHQMPAFEFTHPSIAWSRVCCAMKLGGKDEKKVIHYVNDGLNRVLRGNPPPRERPSDAEKPRYENYWQARQLSWCRETSINFRFFLWVALLMGQSCFFNRYVMEALADAIALVENSNGGKLKPSKMFKRLELWQKSMYQSQPPESTWPGIRNWTYSPMSFSVSGYMWMSWINLLAPRTLTMMVTWVFQTSEVHVRSSRFQTAVPFLNSPTIWGFIHARLTCLMSFVSVKGADLHALFSLLDKDDRGAVDIGEFTRNYQADQHQNNECVSCFLFTTFLSMFGCLWLFTVSPYHAMLEIITWAFSCGGSSGLLAGLHDAAHQVGAPRKWWNFHRGLLVELPAFCQVKHEGGIEYGGPVQVDFLQIFQIWVPVDGSNHTSKKIRKVVSCAKALCDAFLLVRNRSQRWGKNGCADAWAGGETSESGALGSQEATEKCLQSWKANEILFATLKQENIHVLPGFFEWTTEALRSSSAPPNSGRRPEKRSAIDVECAFVGLKYFLFMASYFCSFTKEMMSLLSMAHMAPGTVLLAVCCWLRFDHKDCSRPPGKIQCTVLVSGLLWFTLRFPCNISGCTKLPSCL